MSAASRNVQFAAVTTQRSTHAHALPSVLLGLLAPMLLFLVIDPRALANAEWLAYVYLGVLFVISSGAYLFSVFETPETTSMTADQQRKLITVEKTGLLARSIVEIPFGNVASVHMHARYDNDGYYASVPTLVLTTDETVQLPIGTSDSDIAKLRSILQTSI